MDILCFWGKARSRDADSESRWHPLAFHCLDVAAVGKELLTKHHGLAERFCRLLGMDREVSVRLACFLLCLHDIGKFAKKFQAKAPEFYPKNCFEDNPVKQAYDHGAGGLDLFGAQPDLFRLGKPYRNWRPLISATTGHHGSPPNPEGKSCTALKIDYGTAGIEAAGEFIQQAHELLAVPATLSPPDRKRACHASHVLAGVAVLTDWIGSNERWFSYRRPDVSLEAYWKQAQAQAVHAIREAGILPAAARNRLDYDALITSNAVPSPMQDWTRSVKLPHGPALFMIEDETGSGKTEAALMLAQRLMAPDRKENRADGLYIALPTQTTANAMFDRLNFVHRSLFAEEAVPSLSLVHGARDMHPGFQPVKLQGGPAETSALNIEPSDITASTACADWIADDRRRAFLADVGAGTLDQALLSVLPTRHQSLRLLGLMRRVLILDEVHAYDAYMQREIERLLEFQSGLGGSAILLSATLPENIRRRLMDAFAKGLGLKGEEEDLCMEYPLATLGASNGRVSKPVAGRPGRARTLPVRFLRCPEEAWDEVEQAARAGKAVLYIRNTVYDVLEAHTELEARGLPALLFHARFALSDRLAIEKKVAHIFGKDSRPDERIGKVLIATQVAEQSLDLDFDALITDLAPVDLLIQRAGRLWRHDRPERQGRPELLVVSPPPETDARKTWVSDLFPRGAHVYKNHALLWLTAKVLEEAGKIESPGGLRSLIEAVYGDDAEERVPETLKRSLADAQGKAGAERGIATANLLDFSTGYMRDGGSWSREERTPTRLDDVPQVILRLARLHDGRIEPYAQDDAAPDEPWRAWRLSEVSVPEWRLGSEPELVPPEYAEAAKRLLEVDWTRFDSDKKLLLLEESGAGDTALCAISAESRMRYHPQKGLLFDRQEASPGIPLQGEDPFQSA